MTSALDDAILRDTRRGLARIEHKRTERIVPEMLLLALEREQVVAIAYSEDRVAERIANLLTDPETKEVVRRVVLWVHRDEALHAQYVRGMLLQTQQSLPRLSILSRQLVGAIGGWCSAVSHRGSQEHLGLRRLAAKLALTAGRLTRRVPSVLVSALNEQGFAHFCRLNAALERAAIESYERLLPLIDESQRDVFERILADEYRHAEVFAILGDCFDEEDRLVTDPGQLRERLAEVSPWFLPAHLRPAVASANRSAFGAGSLVHVARDDDRCAALDEALDAVDLDGLVGSGSVAIRCHFMFGYDRRDRSNVVSPALVEAVACRARAAGAADVVVLETPTVYDRFYEHRSVAEVAAYFGFVSDAYRVVDAVDDIRSLDFERGLASTGVSAAWLDASTRIVISKLRTDPGDVAHLSLATLAGIGGRVDDQVHTDRLIDHRTAALMALDVAPPDLAIVDAWGEVADGPIGVMGCDRPSRQNRVYAGRDALSVDAAVLADMGFDDPFVSPFFKQADQWFGASSRPTRIEGEPGRLADFRAPQRSLWYRFVAATAAPIYFHLSRHGEFFVPAFDTEAFPTIGTPSRPVRLVRWSMQRLFGLRPARPEVMSKVEPT